jgi:hypothetical protein
MVVKVKDLSATNAKCTTRYIAKCVGISVGAAHIILRRDLIMRRVSVRWIHHLLANEQNLARAKISKQLLKQFPKYNNQSFANIITGEKTWLHFYGHKRKLHNKIWTTKGSQKRTTSVKKGMYVIFFTN